MIWKSSLDGIGRYLIKSFCYNNLLYFLPLSPITCESLLNNIEWINRLIINFVNWSTRYYAYHHFFFSFHQSSSRLAWSIITSNIFRLGQSMFGTSNFGTKLGSNVIFGINYNDLLCRTSPMSNFIYPFRLHRFDLFGENPFLMHNASKVDQIHEILESFPIP